jgi:Domain of unknown function (DUF4397)
MSRSLTCVLGPLSAGLLVFALGCGSNTTKLRVLHASPDESALNVLIDGKTVSSNLAYGSSTGYLSVSPGSRHLQLEPAGTTTNVLDQTLDLSGNTTVIAANFAANITSLVLTDDTSAAASGNFKLRIVNAAPAIGPVDVYVVPPGTDLTTVSPVVSGLNFESNSDYLSIAAGNYTVEFTPPGSILVLLSAGPTNFAAGQNRTVVALDVPAGGFTSTTLNDRN